MKIGKAQWIALAVLTLGGADTATDPLAPVTESAPAASAALFFGGTANVTNEADSGPGSLPAAIERANLDRSIRVIRVRRGVDRIDIASTLHCTGSQSLRIEGDNGLGGLYVDDQVGGSNPGGADSDATVVLVITNCSRRTRTTSRTASTSTRTTRATSLLA